jgi:hypothetical protein
MGRQMSKPRSLCRRPSLSERLEIVRALGVKTSTAQKSQHDIQQITLALVAEGYTTLDAQAKALGIHRATAWTIVRTKHKLGRLNTKTTERMLANPNLPPSVRDLVSQYRAERPPRKRRTRTFVGNQPHNEVGLLNYDISDEALETAAAIEPDKPSNITMYFCTALYFCPGP